MSEKAVALFQSLAEAFQGPAFQLGYLSGFILLILLALALFLIYLLWLRPRHVSFVTLPAAHGSLQISASAISDLVRSLDPEFDHIEILKVALLRNHALARLEVCVNYQPGGESMPDITARLQQRILGVLKSFFGITTIKEIVIRVKRAPAATDMI